MKPLKNLQKKLALKPVKKQKIKARPVLLAGLFLLPILHAGSDRFGEFVLSRNIGKKIYSRADCGVHGLRFPRAQTGPESNASNSNHGADDVEPRNTAEATKYVSNIAQRSDCRIIRCCCGWFLGGCVFHAHSTLWAEVGSRRERISPANVRNLRS